MELILDGNSEYVAHAGRKLVLVKKDIGFMTALDKIRSLKLLKNRDCNDRKHDIKTEI